MNLQTEHHENIIEYLVDMGNRRAGMAGRIYKAVINLERILTPEQAASLSFTTLKDAVEDLKYDIMQGAKNETI